MKRIIFLLIACMTMAFGYAQDDEPIKIRPLEIKDIVRQCVIMDIEGVVFKDVSVTVDDENVQYRITVTGKNGKKIYEKTFANCTITYNGKSVALWRRNSEILMVHFFYRDNEDMKGWYGAVREKLGVRSIKVGKDSLEVEIGTTKIR